MKAPTAAPELDSEIPDFGAMFAEVEAVKEEIATPVDAGPEVSLIEFPIPNSWTGKTPKILFTEWYRYEDYYLHIII